MRSSSRKVFSELAARLVTLDFDDQANLTGIYLQTKNRIQQNILTLNIIMNIISVLFCFGVNARHTVEGFRSDITE